MYAMTSDSASAIRKSSRAARTAVVSHLRAAAPRPALVCTVFACTVLACTLLVSGCEAFFAAAGLAPPVEYLSVELLAGDRGALHRTAGLYYTVRAVGERDLAALELAFDLYDVDGDPFPAAGRNSFYADVQAAMPPGSERSFCTSLDAYVPDGAPRLAVARFRARTVTFADGGVWRNPGSHCFEEVAE
jgi:hypothetical protein